MSVFVYKGIYYKELVLMIIKTCKSQDQQLANWRPRQLMFPFETEGREKPGSQLIVIRKEDSLLLGADPTFLFYASLLLFG